MVGTKTNLQKKFSFRNVYLTQEKVKFLPLK